MKQLDKTALEIAKTMTEQGKSQGQIAKHLTKLGYQSPRKKRVSQPLVSAFMLKNGVKLTQTATKQTETTEAVEDFLLDVIASKLSRTEKLKVLKALI